MISVPVTVALPIEYSIQVKLDSNMSTLSMLETYSDDIPPGMLEKTIEFFRTLTPRGELAKIGENQLFLKLTSSEWEIAEVLRGEFQMLANALHPCPPTVSPAVFVAGLERRIQK